MSDQRTEPYRKLIRTFLAGTISASSFEKSYIDLFGRDRGGLSESDFEVLDGLYSDVDVFCEDPELRDEGDMDESQLRERAAAALALLDR